MYTLPWTRFCAHPPLLADGKHATALLFESITPARRFEGSINALDWSGSGKIHNGDP
jgi:hypothetical protein